MRKTVSGYILEEKEQPVDLVIHTKVPEKWIFIDTENFGIWAYSGKDEKGKMFRKACLEEAIECERIIEYILVKKLGAMHD